MSRFPLIRAVDHRQFEGPTSIDVIDTPEIPTSSGQTERLEADNGGELRVIEVLRQSGGGGSPFEPPIGHIGANQSTSWLETYGDRLKTVDEKAEFLDVVLVRMPGAGSKHK